MISRAGHPTRYVRYRGSVCDNNDPVVFRSKLESRFADFFDLLDLNWEYEPRRYRLKGGDRSYLPDFYLFEPDVFIEVKPTAFVSEAAWLRRDFQHAPLLVMTDETLDRLASDHDDDRPERNAQFLGLPPPDPDHYFWTVNAAALSRPDNWNGWRRYAKVEHTPTDCLCSNCLFAAAIRPPA